MYKVRETVIANKRYHNLLLFLLHRVHIENFQDKGRTSSSLGSSLWWSMFHQGWRPPMMCLEIPDSCSLSELKKNTNAIKKVKLNYYKLKVDVRIACLQISMAIWYGLRCKDLSTGFTGVCEFTDFMKFTRISPMFYIRRRKLLPIIAKELSRRTSEFWNITWDVPKKEW